MNVDDVMLAIAGKIPLDEENQARMRELVYSISESQRYDLMCKLPTLNLKNPALVFWVGSFVFGNLGVGRFMIGDTGLGVTRLMLFILGTALGGNAIGEFCISVSMIWWIVDLFIVGKKIRLQNLRKILNAMQ